MCKRYHYAYVCVPCGTTYKRLAPGAIDDTTGKRNTAGSTCSQVAFELGLASGFKEELTSEKVHRARELCSIRSGKTPPEVVVMPAWCSTACRDKKIICRKPFRSSPLTSMAMAY
ncbi:uncharacterized protein PG998_012437 [Apiospora kogelbergensis]|uniref:Uncharacterized protein n=1 Tax=Apiospora kogelbergensis TaxID=1337665 RepID=A0AAW0QVP1_9PEZI